MGLPSDGFRQTKNNFAVDRLWFSLFEWKTSPLVSLDCVKVRFWLIRESRRASPPKRSLPLAKAEESPLRHKDTEENKIQDRLEKSNLR